MLITVQGATTKMLYTATADQLIDLMIDFINSRNSSSDID